MTDMNDFTNPDPYVTKVEDVVCRDCGKTFQINAQYDKNGFPVFFRAKYCPECNIAMKEKKSFVGAPYIDATAVGSNLISGNVPQKNVEGLEESLQTLATSIVNARDEFGAFKKHAEYDIEQNTKNIKMNTNDIRTNKLRLDRFEILQCEIDREQSKFNNAILEQIKEIYKTLIIGFSVLVFFMLVTWSYLTYTHFNH